MTRRRWHCANPACGIDNRRTVLGHIRRGALVLRDDALCLMVAGQARALVVCPACQSTRLFDGVVLRVICAPSTMARERGAVHEHRPSAKLIPDN